MNRRASLRARTSGKYSVTYGPTGAAKVLFALRPRLVPPWDDPIRDHFNADGSADSYREFLESVRQELRVLVEDARHFGLQPGKIPRAVKRPHSTLVKLVDEYNWIVITTGVTPPTSAELASWTRWRAESFG